MKRKSTINIFYLKCLFVCLILRIYIPRTNIRHTWKQHKSCCKIYHALFIPCSPHTHTQRSHFNGNASYRIKNVHEMWMLKMMRPVAKKIAAIQYKDGYFYFLIQAATKFYREKKLVCAFFWMKLNVCLMCFIFDDHHRCRLHCIANNEQFYLWSEKKYARFLGVQLYNNSWTMMMMEQISIKWNVYDFPSTSSSC